MAGKHPDDGQPTWIHLPIAEAQLLSWRVEIPRYCETLRWILFDLLAGFAGIMSLLSAWLWIRYLRRPDPRQMLMYPDATSTPDERAS